MTTRFRQLFSPLLLTFAALATLSLANHGHADETKPNVVFILADDLGWSDTTLFGTTEFYKTPHIERLAQRGLTFTRAYTASPLCSPTRSAILTGLSPARTGLTTPNCHLPQVVLQAETGKAAPPNKHAIAPTPITRLKTDYPTLSRSLHDAGYVTGHFGKWHLGPEPYSPLEQFFDVDIPHWPGPGPAGSYVAPWKFKDFDHDPDVPDQHIEDRMAQEAVEFLQQNQDKTFFLNYWMFSVHAPFDAKKSLIEKYRDTVDPNDPQRCPTYAAMVESMDDAVGTLLDTLDRLELTKNTIIVFTSDNGGNMYNKVEGVPPTSNAPLRGGKASMFEGGTRVPCVIVWPEITTANTRSEALIQSEDFFPTLLDGLGLPPAPDQIFDGVSIMPALRGESLERDAVFQYFPHDPPVPDWIPPSVSVHQGDWKLIRIFHAGQNTQHRYMLFNLADDIGETNNLADQNPELVKRLDALITNFLAETNAVVPVPNPRFDPAQYNPEMEGVGRIRNQAKPAGKTKRPPGKPVAGWTPGGTATLSLDGDILVIQSDGGDPYVSRTLPTATSNEGLVAEVTLVSDSHGYGQVFWTEQGRGAAFSAERSVRFEVQHDGEPHRYVVPLTAAAPLLKLRIDPSRGRGTLRLLQVRLKNADGQLLQELTK